MLVKNRGQPNYFLSKNPQIKLWHRRHRYASNAKVVKASKLNDKINILIKDDQKIEKLSSDSE